MKHAEGVRVQPLALSRSARASLLNEAWNRHPTVLSNPAPEAFPTGELVYDSIRCVADGILAGSPLQNFRLHFEHESPATPAYQGPIAAAVASPYTFMPRKADRTLESYARVLQRRLGGVRFGLVVNECQRHFPLWLKLQSFVDDLRAGIPYAIGGIEIASFIGNYRRTPFGIHKDLDHVFTFVVAGEKHVLLWPWETFANAEHSEVPPDPSRGNVLLFVRNSREYSRALKSAIRLTGRPGDVMYWPASYWHIALGNGRLATTLALGVGAPQPKFVRAGADLDDGRGVWSRDDLAGTSRGDERFPSPRLSSLLASLGTGPRSTQQRQKALAAWLRTTTGQGFDPVPDLGAARALSLKDRVRRRSTPPLVWTRLNRDTVLLAGIGQSLVSPAHPGVGGLVADLNSGATCVVQELVERYASVRRSQGVTYQLEPDGIVMLLEQFVRWRALEVVGR